MIRRNSRHAMYVSLAVISLLFGSTAIAADVSGDAHGVNLANVSSSSQRVMVTGLNGYSSLSRGNSLKSSNGAPLADGTYRYEVIETKCVNISYVEIATAKRDNAANGREADAQPNSCRDVVVDSGAFRIVNGTIPSKGTADE